MTNSKNESLNESKIVFETNDQMTTGMYGQYMSLMNDDSDRAKYLSKSRLTLKPSRLILGEERAEFIVDELRTILLVGLTLSFKECIVSAGGSLKLTAGSGKQLNGNVGHIDGNGGHIVLQGGSNFAISAGRNKFRLQDPRDKSSCNIMILKRGSLKNISITDSLSKFKLNLVPSFESGFKEFKVFTNASNVTLNATSNNGSCKVLSGSTTFPEVPKCFFKAIAIRN